MRKKPSYAGYKKRLRAFRYFKDLLEPELEEKARELYNKKYGHLENSLEEDVQITENEVGTWISKKEAKEADKLFRTYVSKNNIINFSDIALLKTLVNYEVQLRRIQNVINKEIRDAVDRNEIAPVPVKELRIVNDINTQILSLKKVLGLSDEKKGNDPLEYISSLKRKMFTWAKEMYQASRFRRCPFCSKPLLLLMRPEVWEAYKHPFFKDNYICNEHVWKLYKENRLTKEDVALILIGTLNGIYYVDWWIEKMVKEEEKLVRESGDIDVLEESGLD